MHLPESIAAITRSLDLTERISLRVKKASSAAKQRCQTYLDSCDRNAVEGRIGNFKRRFGLTLIYCKMDRKSQNEASLNTLVMNVAYRRCQWLMGFFCFFREVMFSQ